MDGCLRLTGLLLLCVLETSPALAVEPQTSSIKPTLVISMAYREPSGLRRPVVEVWSSGEVRAIELRGTRQNPVEVPAVDRLASAECRELIECVRDEWRLDQVTTESIEQSLRIASEARQLTAEIPNAAMTELTVIRNGETVTIACPAVSILSTRFPEVEEVQQIARAQTRLLNIAAIALVGGQAQADRLASAATSQLRTTHPASTVTRHDLRMVRRLADGSRFVQFAAPAVTGHAETCLVSMTQSPQGATRVSVLESPAVVR